MSIVVLEETVDCRVIESLSEEGLSKLNDSAIEWQDTTDSDIDYVRLYSQ